MMLLTGLGHKIDRVAKKKGCLDVRLWKKSILNHLYFVATTATNGDKERMEGMWKSVANHVQDIHEHDNDTYVMCDHAHLMGEDRNKQWLPKGNLS